MSDITPEFFITKIKVDKVRNIKDFEIPLSETKRTHLILTGKNGSGKTSLLLDINKHLTSLKKKGSIGYENFRKQAVQNQELHETGQLKTSLFEANLRTYTKILRELGGVSIFLSDSNRLEISEHGKKLSETIPIFLLDSKRKSKFIKPSEIKNIEFSELTEDKLSETFLKHLVNRRAQRAFAREEEHQQDYEELNQWFIRFETGLKHLFDDSSFKLVFKRKELNFEIHLDGQEPFTFSELSDGYSAILNIVTELIMRMEARIPKAYDLEGIILIDEIENHLHVDLQKKILPFLCDFFPKVQFIVSTHSPFVLSSVSNAVICDLEKRIVTSDLSGYSYSTLVESYFGLDQYSAEVKEKLADYKRLSKSRPTDEDKDYYFELKHYFEALPKYLAPELQMELKSIQLSMLPKKD